MANTLSMRRPPMSRIAFLSMLTAALAVVAPSRTLAQGATPIGVVEDSLSATDWTARARAVTELATRAREVTPGGRTQLVALLGEELDGSASASGPAEDEEAYGQYMMQLTVLITRFNEPRAVPLLARQGIAITNGAVFRVAMAGDAGIGPLLSTWAENEALRPAVVRTLGEMRYYADSTGRALSAQTRASIDDYILRSSIATAPWLRHAFLDAAESTGDPVYLPIVADLAANDPAAIDGLRYVASDAGALAARLEQRREGAAPQALLRSLQAGGASACRLDWIRGDGICNSLRVKLDGAADALARGQPQVASSTLRAFLAELSAQRGTSIDERAYLLLSGNAEYLITRL